MSAVILRLEEPLGVDFDIAIVGLREHSIGELLEAGELPPHRCILVILCRVIEQPTLEVRHGQNLGYDLLTSLALEGELAAVEAFHDVANGQVVNLTAAGIGVPCGADAHRYPSDALRRYIGNIVYTNLKRMESVPKPTLGSVGCES
jgi:hypothetical protein